MRGLPRRIALVAPLAVALVAQAAGAQAPAQPRPAIITRAPLDQRAGVNFHALVLPETVYVGQQANYQVGVFLDDEVRRRLRRNPEFVPPEMPGVLAYELPVSHGTVPRASGGTYEVHVFERAVFPLTPGTHTIQPARLSYSLPLTSSFFSREESHSLRSQSRRIVALATPAAGRPPEFDGAVARDVVVRTIVEGRDRARVGDPLRVTLRVSGKGNVNLFPRPRFAPAWGQAVAAGERVTLDSTSRVVAGVKEFDWLLTPHDAGTVQVPAVRYAYFDPVVEEYAVAEAAPEALTIAAGTIAQADSVTEAQPALPLRPIYRGETAPAPASGAPYWVAVALLPLPALVVRRRRRVPRARPATPPEAELRALAGLDATRPSRRTPASVDVVVPDVRRVRSLYLRAVGVRLGRPIVAVGRSGAFARLLRREGVSPDVARDADALLDLLDRASYALEPHAAEDLARRAAESFARIDGEARRPRVALGAARTALLALVASGTLAAAGVAAHLGAAAPAAEEFARGVEAYEARAFTVAGAHFARAAQFAPRAADAWANYGTASWAAGDTAGAAVGWQRALRLQPLATDARERLGLIPSPQLDGAASVPPLPPALLQWLALAAWAVTWGGAAWSGWRRRRADGPVVLLAGMGAILLGGAAVWEDEKLSARDLAVVAEAGASRSQPALTADPSASLLTGEIVRVEARQGAWARVRPQGGASSWVEWSRLRELRRL